MLGESPPAAAREACYVGTTVVSESDRPKQDALPSDGTEETRIEPTPDARERKSSALAEHPGEPPVVARMIVEIRSDGTRTVARGAIEDVGTGERVAVEAHGASPMALAASLAKSMFSAPMLAKQAVRALLASRKGSKGGDSESDP